MNTTEMRELDAWIATHVMRWRNEPTPSELDRQGFHPTTDPAAAMMVMEKCAERGEITSIQTDGKLWRVDAARSNASDGR